MLSDASAAAQCVAPPRGLVSWWPGDTNATDIQDGNDGTLQNGVFYDTGIVGTSFGFDGIDDYVLVPESPNLDFAPGSSITIELWAYRTSDYYIQHLLGKRDGCRGDKDFYQLAIAPNAIPIESVPRNVWTHLAVVYDGSNGIERQYVNGLLVNEGTSILGSNTAPLEIGNSGDCSSFGGSIDEVAIYSRALDSSEIQAIFNAGNSGKCKPASPICVTVPLIAMTWSMACAANNWVHLSGEIESEDGEPLCALVLANGQYMFSCYASLGWYDLTVPVDENGNITLFGFADGFQPYSEIFVAPNCAR